MADLDVSSLSSDERLKVVCVVAARSPRVRTALPAALRGEHSLVDLPPLRADEAAVEVMLTTARISSTLINAPIT